MFFVCFGFNLKTAQTYRTKILPDIVKYQQRIILDSFYDKDFALYFDETTDANGRFILNIMAKILDGEISNTFLISTESLEKTNSSNVTKKIEFAIATLTQGVTFKHRFKHLVSDKATYCLKTGRELKQTYPTMKHLICLCHNLHLIAEEIRKRSPVANELITEL